jgi:hypothetical protein
LLLEVNGVDREINTDLQLLVEFNKPLQAQRTLRKEKERVIRLNATWDKKQTLFSTKEKATATPYPIWIGNWL